MSTCGAGLLLYDVFWVFGTPYFTGGESVMMTVATSSAVQGPTRLLFPKPPSLNPFADAGAFPFSLLGLGDIAVPGLLLGLCLRYDASRAVDLRPRAEGAISAIEQSLAKLPADANRQQHGEAAVDAAFEAYDRVADEDDAQRNATTSGSDADAVDASSADGGHRRRRPVSDAVMSQRRYFTPTLISYVVGLCGAFAVNAVTHAGQPALLYICPAMLATVLAVAASRREVGRLWSFLDLPSTPPPWMRDSEGGADAAK